MFEPAPRYRYVVRVVEREKILLEYRTYCSPRISVGTLLKEVEVALSRIIVTPQVEVHFELTRVIE